MFVPIHNCQKFYFVHILGTLVGLEKSSGLAPALGVTKFIVVKDMI